MKIQITFKDPDGVSNSLDSAVEESLPEGLDAEEAHALREMRQEKYQEAIKPWVEYGEYVHIEIDTNAGTAVVVKAGG